MNKTPISAWAVRSAARSPDNMMEAKFEDGMEVAMGSPTIGKLSVFFHDGRKKIISEDATASFVWSDDSKYLAYSRWTRFKKQQLCVFRVKEISTHVFPGKYRVLELSSFNNGIVEGIDSPIYQPKTISLEYKE